MSRSEPSTVAVIGTGTMGRGIMQVAAEGGCRVLAFDERSGVAESAIQSIRTVVASLVTKGRMEPAAADALIARLSIAPRLDDVAAADVVIEAIVEKLDAKQALFAQLESVVRPDAILASNTSSIPITAIASKAARPERIAGLHFFNPVPLMKLAEVIPGLKTAPAVTEALIALAKRMGREPVLCTDSPGFIVNHVGRGLLTECPRILSEQIASTSDIDAILTGAPGFRIGMFALADLVGIDVGHAVMESFNALYYGEPMYQPNPLTAQRVAGGLHGRKTGAGWHRYQNGERIAPPPRTVPPRGAHPIWVRPDQNEPTWADHLRQLFATSGPIEMDTAPSAGAVIVTMPIGDDVTMTALDLKLDPKRTVGVDMLFGLKGPRTLMVTPATAPDVIAAVHAALAADGQPVVVINDSPGYVAQRVVAMIVNVACTIAQRGIASPADIDKATRLGLGYPYGPLEWGDRIGPGRILHILDCLHRRYREPRYRPSPWLSRRAALGLPLTTPDAVSISA
jgi:3-hydroxybutyryl-CoA dehydrogenase